MFGRYRAMLPSGRRVRMRRPRAPVRPAEGHLYAEALAAIESGAFEVRGPSGAPIDARSLVLSDFHFLRFHYERLGRGRHRSEHEYHCHNCEAPFEGDPYRLVPETHFLRRSAPDEPAPDRLRLPRPLRIDGAKVRELRIAPVTVAQALPLWRVLARDAPIQVTPEIVAALGIVAADPAAVGRGLDTAADEVWDCLGYAFNEINYPADFFAPYFCRECGARNDVEVPPDREFAPEEDWSRHLGPAPEAAAKAAPFPKAAAFEDRVRAIGERVYRDKGVRNIALVVETGPPVCDSGGEPLLGSYRPLGATEGPVPQGPEFEIALYFESFRRMYDEDGPYDVDAEIEETIAHEVDHHLSYLAGKDEEDEEEVGEIARETAATWGRKELARGFFAALGAEAWRLLVFALPVLALAAVVALVVGWCG